jgi:3'-phosphoadenosine 5'-phosphosulfate sulfotransferase (PAPS reductase)/FAD synthetase
MEKMLEYDKLAIFHFEKKKEMQRLATQLKKDGKKEEAKLYRDKVAFHKAETEKYDKLAFEEAKKIDLIKAYDEQTRYRQEEYIYRGQKRLRTFNNRASRVVRYFHLWASDSMTLKEKERWAIDITKLALSKSERPSISCSFGIDSIVTLYIVRKALVELGRNPSDIQVVWCDTLNEFPEVRQYAKWITDEWNLNLLVQKPKKVLKKIIEDYGGVDSSYFFVTKGNRKNHTRPLSERCCETLKHEPMREVIRKNNWDLQINGIRADESAQRKNAILRDGQYFYSSSEWKTYVCRPIQWFTEKDIWEYVEQESIPYNDLYKKNMILSYPQGFDIDLHIKELQDLNFDIDGLRNRQLYEVTRLQSIKLEELGFKMFTPKTGCQMCPIPVKYQYLQWMRHYHPKAYKAMIYNLGYGKVLLGMIPQEVKDEIEMFLGITLTEENAHEHMKDILTVKPCTFDTII